MILGHMSLSLGGHVGTHIEEVKKEHGDDMFVMWDTMVKLYLSVLVSAIQPFGYTADAIGLQAFSVQLVQLQQTHGRGQELAEMNKKTWKALIEM